MAYCSRVKSNRGRTDDIPPHSSSFALACRHLRRRATVDCRPPPAHTSPALPPPRLSTPVTAPHPARQHADTRRDREAGEGEAEAEWRGEEVHPPTAAAAAAAAAARSQKEEQQHTTRTHIVTVPPIACLPAVTHAAGVGTRAAVDARASSSNPSQGDHKYQCVRIQSPSVTSVLQGPQLLSNWCRTQARTPALAPRVSPVRIRYQRDGSRSFLP